MIGNESILISIDSLMGAAFQPFMFGKALHPSYKNVNRMMVAASIMVPSESWIAAENEISYYDRLNPMQ
jgi:hypothetical protein